MSELSLRPKEIRKSANGLQVVWSDEKLEVVPFAAIRQACSCAVCREFQRPPNYSEPRFQLARTIHSMDLVGNYAVGIMWQDSHRTIMTFERLRGLMENAATAACSAPADEVAEPISITPEDVEAALSAKAGGGCGKGQCGCRSTA